MGLRLGLAFAALLVVVLASGCGSSRSTSPAATNPPATGPTKLPNAPPPPPAHPPKK